jgi:hypothetical protein
MQTMLPQMRTHAAEPDPAHERVHVDLERRDLGLGFTVPTMR